VYGHETRVVRVDWDQEGVGTRGCSETGRAAMTKFAFTSYKSEGDRELLNIFSDAVYLLKLQAQNRPVSVQDIADKRSQLDAILENLINQVRALGPGLAPGLRISEFTSRASGSDDIETDDSDIDFTNFAFRFIRFNPADVNDRLEEVERLRKSLLSNNHSALNSREFNLLDRLQTLLEAEVARSVQSLYAF